MNKAAQHGPFAVDARSLAACGNRVTIDPSVRLFGDPAKLQIGDDVRIDSLCLISIGDQGIRIGRNVHIAAGCFIYGFGGRVTLEDFSGLSARVTIYTASDDYRTGCLTNPTVDAAFRNLDRGPVRLEKHAIVGAGSVILPNTTIGFGAAVGALTVIRKNVDPGSIVVGNPSRVIPGKRDLEKLRLLEREYLSGRQDGMPSQ
jgi:dTDP-4-amino-4,6-dideoxy-D-glucose acyltransferase